MHDLSFTAAAKTCMVSMIKLERKTEVCECIEKRNHEMSSRTQSTRKIKLEERRNAKTREELSATNNDRSEFCQSVPTCRETCVSDCSRQPCYFLATCECATEDDLSNETNTAAIRGHAERLHSAQTWSLHVHSFFVIVFFSQFCTEFYIKISKTLFSWN